MGLFDFLNPKKTIEKKLRRQVELEMGRELATLRTETDPVKRRAALERAVEIRLQHQANEIIPPAMRKHSRPIMKNVSHDIVTKLERELNTPAHG